MRLLLPLLLAASALVVDAKAPRKNTTKAPKTMTKSPCEPHKKKTSPKNTTGSHKK